MRMEITWSIREKFSRPIIGADVLLEEVSLQWPEGFDERIRANWQQQVEEEHAITGFEIRPYHMDESMNALYDGETPKMWPGSVISLQSYRVDGDTLILRVGQTSFPYIKGVQDEELRDLFDRQGMHIPPPAIAVNNLPLTIDDKIALTLRGNVNKYPHRFYGIGGDPTTVDTNIVQHQLDELEDEMLVPPDAYDTSGYRFIAIIDDGEDLPGKPDLVGWVQLSETSDMMKERYLTRPRSERPEDAVGLRFAPSTEGELFHYLTRVAHPRMFTPSTFAGLILYGGEQYGQEWSDRVLRELESL